MNIKELKNEIERKERELTNLKTQLENIHEYETVIILNPTTTIENFDEIKKEIEKIIDNENILKFENLGTKQLAYKIKENKKGYYLTWAFNGIMKTISELEKFYRENENVLKYITIKKEN